MKPLLQIISVIFTLTAAAYASAASPDSFLRDESLSEAVVTAPFNLRASDGSVVSFLPKAVKDDNNLKNLPPEIGDHSHLCSGNNDIDLYLSLTSVFIRLADDALKNRPMALLPADIALIQQTPRCGRLKESLTFIANILATETQTPTENLKKVSLVGSQLRFTTETGKAVNFAVAKLPKKIRDLSDLTQMQIDAATSGQNLSVKLKFHADRRDSQPTTTYTTESCTYSYQVETCDPRGLCWTQTFTETGYRYVTTTTTFDMVEYSLNFIDAQNQVVFQSLIYDGEFDSTRDVGTCGR